MDWNMFFESVGIMTTSGVSISIIFVLFQMLNGNKIKRVTWDFTFTIIFLFIHIVSTSVYIGFGG